MRITIFLRSNNPGKYLVDIFCCCKIKAYRFTLKPARLAMHIFLIYHGSSNRFEHNQKWSSDDISTDVSLVTDQVSVLSGELSARHIARTGTVRAVLQCTIRDTVHFSTALQVMARGLDFGGTLYLPATNREVKGGCIEFMLANC